MTIRMMCASSLAATANPSPLAAWWLLPGACSCTVASMFAAGTCVAAGATAVVSGGENVEIWQGHTHFPSMAVSLASQRAAVVGAVHLGQQGVHAARHAPHFGEQGPDVFLHLVVHLLRLRARL